MPSARWNRTSRYGASIARIRCRFARQRGDDALHADVEIVFGEDYRELLAHEFEHVIERIDGVDLRREASEGRAWESADGLFETRRACLAGARVRTEAGVTHASTSVPLPAR